jgi:hypothetical protein
MSEVKHLDKRPHNKDAYNEYDSKAKTVLIEIMKNLGYCVHGDPNEENYKKYDLNFYNPTTQKFFAVENEVREKFDLIRDRWDTVHIPVRKSTTQMDSYFVWNRNLNQIIVISRPIFLKYIGNLVDVDCDSEVLNGDRIAYKEKFIDIPKSETKFYYVTQGFKLNDGIPNPELFGFANYK